MAVMRLLPSTCLGSQTACHSAGYKLGDDFEPFTTTIALFMVFLGWIKMRRERNAVASANEDLAVPI